MNSCGYHYTDEVSHIAVASLCETELAAQQTIPHLMHDTSPNRPIRIKDKKTIKPCLN